MEPYQGQEKRRESRTDLMTWCPTRIRFSGCEHRSMMVNLSLSGAGIRLEEDLAASTFSEGDELDLAVHTPYGETSCQARVAWLATENGLTRLGVEFIRLSGDREDPLRCLMNSPF